VTCFVAVRRGMFIVFVVRAQAVKRLSHGAGVQRNECFYTSQSPDVFILSKAYSCHLVPKNVQTARRDTNMTYVLYWMIPNFSNAGSVLSS
jgi:hypothetical protein